MSAEVKTYRISLFIALLFHISGAIGIIFSSNNAWFIHATPYLLLLMTFLLLLNHPSGNNRVYVFAFLVYITGFLVEIIGVNTGYLFGQYVYEDVLGVQWMGVPLIIGVNWFIIVYCAACIMGRVEIWLLNKLEGINHIKPAIQTFSFVVDAAVLTTFFDWIMEPAAQKLGYWQWLPNGQVPFFNYISWFIISAGMLLLFKRLNIKPQNHFAVHLFIIQVLFFLVLKTFL